MLVATNAGMLNLAMASLTVSQCQGRKTSGSCWLMCSVNRITAIGNALSTAQILYFQTQYQHVI